MMNAPSVIPANAGTHLLRVRRGSNVMSGAPAFAGVTRS